MEVVLFWRSSVAAWLRTYYLINNTLCKQLVCTNQESELYKRLSIVCVHIVEKSILKRRLRRRLSGVDEPQAELVPAEFRGHRH